MTQMPSAETVLQASHQAGLSASAAELHGALSGWLAGGGADEAGWPAKVMADASLATPADDSPLDALRQATRTQLDDDDFAFDLLLAPVDASLEQRAEGLFEWCRGFLGGFGLAAGATPPLSEEAQEALHDLARLAQAAGGGIDSGDEDNEAALAEIEEFVRVAVLLLHGDCVMGPRHRQRLN